MTTVLLIRHGRTASNAKAILAGWAKGVDLDAVGQAQADLLAKRLSKLTLSAIVSSPLPRCFQTAKAIAASQPRGRSRKTSTEVVLDERLAECRYGDWTGKKLATLAKDPLWQIVQTQPSAVHFPGPGSESLLAVSQRANEAVAFWASQKSPTKIDPSPILALVSHGDVIKSILANALGMHLDMFQRIVVDPCSVSIVRYTPSRPYVVATNMVDVDFDFLTKSRPKKTVSEAVVGGGKGERR